jgi:hypothetical protein
MAKHLHWGGRALMAAAAGALLSTAAPAPASAQFFFFRNNFFRPYQPYPPRPLPLDEELTPREIVDAVHRRGFRDVAKPVYREDVALVTATSREGKRLRLSIDIMSGRIIDAAPAPKPRQQLAQRAPDQGAAVRRAVPETRRDIRATPEKPPAAVRREPILPPQPQQATPPRPPLAQPQKPVAQPPAPAPPSAKVEPARPEIGTKTQPRRIDMPPPAALDDAGPPVRAPTGPPINSVPPAGLE